MYDYKNREEKGAKHLAHLGTYALLILALISAHFIITTLPASSAITGMAVSQETSLHQGFDWSPFLGFSYVLFGVLLVGIVLKTHQERNAVPSVSMDSIPAFIRQRFVQGHKKGKILQQLVNVGWAPDVAQEIFARYEREYNSV